MMIQRGGPLSGLLMGINGHLSLRCINERTL